MQAELAMMSLYLNYILFKTKQFIFHPTILYVYSIVDRYSYSKGILPQIISNEYLFLNMKYYITLSCNLMLLDFFCCWKFTIRKTVADTSIYQSLIICCKMYRRWELRTDCTQTDLKFPITEKANIVYVWAEPRLKYQG